MAYAHIDYEFQVAHFFHKQILWISTNCNVYFGMKVNINDEWSYWAGNASHALATGQLLSYYGTSEISAQTNYLTTTRDSNGKVLGILPGIFQAKYVRLYVETGANVKIYEWRPSTLFSAHEIITGELHITDQLSDAPLIRVTKSSIDRIKIGNLYGTTYGLSGFDANSATIFELSNTRNQIAGWDLTATQLTKNNAIICSSGKIKLGSGNNIIRLDSQNTTYRIWSGHDNPASAPFSVTKTGSIRADQGLIAGWDVTSSQLSKNAVILSNAGKVKVGAGNDTVVLDSQDATYREWIGHSNPASALFRVTKGGKLYSTGPEITINTASGLIIDSLQGLIITASAGLTIRQGGDITLEAGTAGNKSIIYLYDGNDITPSEIRFINNAKPNKYWRIVKSKALHKLAIGPSASLVATRNSLLSLGAVATNYRTRTLNLEASRLIESKIDGTSITTFTKSYVNLKKPIHSNIVRTEASLNFSSYINNALRLYIEKSGSTCFKTDKVGTPVRLNRNGQLTLNASVNIASPVFRSFYKKKQRFTVIGNGSYSQIYNYRKWDDSSATYIDNTTKKIKVLTIRDDTFDPFDRIDLPSNSRGILEISLAATDANPDISGIFTITKSSVVNIHSTIGSCLNSSKLRHINVLDKGTFVRIRNASALGDRYKLVANYFYAD